MGGELGVKLGVVCQIQTYKPDPECVWCWVGSFKIWKSVESFGCQPMHDPMRRFLIGSCIPFRNNSTPSTEVTHHQHIFHVLQQHFIWNNMDKTAETVWQLTEIILFIFSSVYFIDCSSQHVIGSNSKRRRIQETLKRWKHETSQRQTTNFLLVSLPSLNKH